MSAPPDAATSIAAAPVAAAPDAAAPDAAARDAVGIAPGPAFVPPAGAQTYTVEHYVETLGTVAQSYLDADQVAEIARACTFGTQAHDGQMRASGEPYIAHPIQVATILADMRLDAKTIVAAILHDVIEDTEHAKPQVAAAFGSEVAELVDGVSKFRNLSFESRAEAQAENFRKMMMAMARDIRVILVKLADRLHNMRTLDALRPDKRRRIARETLEIYGPIASRLGLNFIRLELEDLGFRALYPMRYRALSREIVKARGHSRELVEQIEQRIRTRFDAEGIEVDVAGREKHVYSVYRKMRDKGLRFRELLDVNAFRINVGSVDDCYRALGVVHNVYNPLPGRFKDYIALPKPNGYQSLHTVLLSPNGGGSNGHSSSGNPIEIQIRTDTMHAVAESGIAAHFAYKGGDNNEAHERARQWIQDLLKLQSEAGNSVEFLENVKVDLFPRSVYVFTPAGEIKSLPRGSTAVDLAYSVHTDIGNTCYAARINGNFAPLRTHLNSGQIVEVLTAPWGRPNANWLDFVRTGKARSAIRSFLKNQQAEEAIELGRQLLAQALEADGKALSELDADQLQAAATALGAEGFEDVLNEIGLGKRLAILVARRVLALDADTDDAAALDGAQPLLIRGSEGMVLHFGRCCRPIPGDAIIGHVSSGRGLVVHVTDCPNTASYATRPDVWVDVAWEDDIDGTFPVDVRVDTPNQRGALATIAAAIAETGANIENVSMKVDDGVNAALDFRVGVSGRKHLARVLRRVRGVPEVVRIARSKS